MQPLGDSGPDAPPDHAGVAFHPPILLVAFLLLGFGLRACGGRCASFCSH